MLKIGFIGLGHMGLPMAKNLIKANCKVSGFDLQNEPLQELVNSGGFALKSIKEIASSQDVIITMLQTGQQVLSVYLGDNGLLNNAKANTLFIDCSTIDVKSAREINTNATKLNLSLVDAPVSGGVNGAAAGTLTFMVGGSAKDYDKAQSILKFMGTKIIHTGEAGNGQAAKICNNMVLGISMIAISEAFTLSKSLGLSDEKLHEVISAASGQCWVMDKYVPVPNLLTAVPANNDYKPGFTTNMMLKDLNLSQDCAKTSGVKTKLASLATQIYQKAHDDGLGELDFSAIIKEINS
jgi:3-hydroxyisobutyrate dehydrogenase